MSVRDIAVRFKVTDNEIATANDRIAAGALKAQHQLDAMGKKWEDLARKEQASLREYLKIQAAWDASAKYQEKLFSAQQRLMALQNAGRMTEIERLAALKKIADALAYQLALEERLNAQRQRGGGAGGSGNATFNRQMATDAATAAEKSRLATQAANAQYQQAKTAAAGNREFAAQEIAARDKLQASIRAQKAAEAELNAYQKQARAAGATGVDQATTAARKQVQVDAQRIEQGKRAAETRLASEAAIASYEQRIAARANFDRSGALRTAREAALADVNFQNAESANRIAAGNRARGAPKDQVRLAEEEIAARKRLEAATVANAEASRREAVVRQEAASLKVRGIQQEMDAEKQRTRVQADSDASSRVRAKTAAESAARSAAVASFDRAGVMSTAQQFGAARSATGIARTDYTAQQAATVANPANLSNEIAARDRLSQAMRRQRELADQLGAAMARASELGITGLGRQIRGAQQSERAIRDQIAAQERATQSAGAMGSAANKAFDVSKAPGLLKTINDISFGIFVLTYSTQQLGQVFLRTFIQAGEHVEGLRVRLEMMTGSTAMFGQVLGVAQEVGIGVAMYAQAFSRFAIANKDIGLTNEKLVEMSRNIAIIGMAGGGTVQEVTSGMQQLGQALASGRLQGDELRSIRENIPLLALKLADALNVPIGALKEMGSTGQLTSKKLAEAFLSMTDDANKMLRDVPVTSERGLARISNSWGELVSAMLRVVGVDTVGTWFSNISHSMDGFVGKIPESRAQIGGLLAAFTGLATQVAILFLVFQGVRMVDMALGFVGVAAGVGKMTTAFKEANAAALVLARTRAYEAGATVLPTSLVRGATGIGTAVAGAYTVLTNALKAYAPILLLITVIGLATAAWSRYSASVAKSAEDAKKAVDDYASMDAMKLAALSRTEATSKSAASYDQLKTQTQELTDLANKTGNATSMVEVLKRTIAQADPADKGTIAMYNEQLRYHQAEERKSAGAIEAKTAEVHKSVAAMQAYETQSIASQVSTDAAARANKSLAKSFKDIADAVEDLPKKLESLRLEVKLIAEIGPEEAANVVKVFEAVRQYREVEAETNRVFAERQSQIAAKYAAGGGAGSPTVPFIGARPWQQGYTPADPNQNEVARTAEILKAVRERDALLMELRRGGVDLNADVVAEERRKAEATKAWNAENKGAAGARFQDRMEYSRQAVEILGVKPSLQDSAAKRLAEQLPLIEKASKAYGVLKELIIAVMYTESKFDPNARSPKNAQGLMQITPPTAEWLHSQHKVGMTASEILSDPENNVMAGTKYLKILLGQYGTYDQALGAYNGGKKGASGAPYEETRKYKAEVLDNFNAMMEMPGASQDKLFKRQQKAEQQRQTEEAKQRAFEQRSQEATAQSHRELLALDTSYAGRRASIEARRTEEILKLERERNGEAKISEQAKTDRIVAINSQANYELRRIEQDRLRYQRETADAQLAMAEGQGATRVKIEAETAAKIREVMLQVRDNGLNPRAAQARIQLLSYQGSKSAEGSHLKDIQAGVTSATDNLNNGVGTWGDSVIAVLGKVSVGFTSLGSSVTSAMGSMFSSLTDGFANSMGRAIVYSEDLNTAMQKVAQEAVANLISALIKMGIQWAAQALLGQTIGVAATAAQAAQMSAIAAAAAPAAALVSLATGGTNAASAIAGMATADAFAMALAAGGGMGFASGGYTGDVPTNQVVGAVHGQEFVVNAQATASNRALLEQLNSGGTLTTPTVSASALKAPVVAGVSISQPVTINNTVSHDTQATARPDGSGGLTIDIVRAAIASDFRTGGNMVANSAANAFGLQRRGR